jgi:hypothetical protein
MSITVYENGSINIDNESTGLMVTQIKNGTLVYSPEKIGGGSYKEHPMPKKRYSLSHDKPASGNAGRIDFENDIKELLKQLNK